MPGISSNHPPGRRGAVLVEMALVLPLLVFMALGCVDFGRFAYTYITVTNAAREGASAGAMAPTAQAAWQQKIRSAVVAEMQGMADFDSSKLQLPAATVVTESNGEKRVHVKAGYPFYMSVPWPGLPSGLMIWRTVEMRSIR